MCLRDIDCIEVEILCCHLHRVIDIESHPYKCILHLSLYERDRMETTMLSQEWYCHILLLTRESLGDQVFFDPGTLRFEGVGDDIASLVRGFTYCSSLLWGEILESLQYCREFARLAEDNIAIVDESCLVDYRWEVGEDGVLEILDLFYHILYLEWHDEVTVGLL